MASNPMQRKARNSFLLGMLVMLLIAGVVIAFLVIQLKGKIDKENEDKKATVNVYVLNQDVKSGQVITEDMFIKQAVNKNFVPSNATSDLSVVQNYALQDKEGNNIYTKTDKDEAKLYITIQGKEYELKKEEETENYYYTKTSNNGEKTYVQLNSVPLIAKIDMNKNTVITTDLISKGNNVLQNDVRKQEYNMLVLPMDLTTGDYVDVRIMFPSGQDYIVVSKKEVEIPNVGGVDSVDTVYMNLSEDEIVHLSCAIIDAYQLKGAKIYCNKYTEAGMQESSTPTYPVNAATTKLLTSDPNILEKAMNAIRNRYNATGADRLRESIDSVISNQEPDEAKSSIETNMDKSITNSKENRKSYLDGISGNTTNQ